MISPFGCTAGESQKPAASACLIPSLRCSSRGNTLYWQRHETAARQTSAVVIFGKGRRPPAKCRSAFESRRGRTMFRNWSASERTSIVMTRLLVSVFVLVTALLVTDRSVLAQQSAYSYPWCLERGIGGPRSCYYSSYEQCWQEAFTRLGGDSARRAPTIDRTQIGLSARKRHAIGATARLLQSDSGVGPSRRR